MVKKDLIQYLNQGLELEHAAKLQYLSHAEVIRGLNAEPVINRLKEISGDEEKHAEKFRSMISMLGGVPSTGIAKTYNAKSVKDILEINIKAEKEAIDFYKKILDSIKNDKELKYEDFYIVHELNHIIIDEMEHVQELKLLLGKV
jgi:bacterioferritin